MRPWVIGAGTIAGLVLLILVAAWIFRVSVAAWAAKNWCQSNAFRCELNVATLNLSELRVSGLTVENEAGKAPLEVQDATVAWRWDGFLKPVVTRVELTRPVLRASYSPSEDRQITFGGLEALTGAGGSSDAALPELSITDATIEVETPAGSLALNGSFSGKLPYEGNFRATIPPVALESRENRLVVREGVIDLSFEGFRVDGQASINLAEAEFDGLSVRNATLSANMAGMLMSHISWAASLDRLTYQDATMEKVDFSGTLQPRAGGPDDNRGWLGRIKSAGLSGSLEQAKIAAFTSGPATMSLDLSHAGPDRVKADIAIEGEDIALPGGSARRVIVSGNVSTGNLMESVTASGDVIAEAATLNGHTRETLLSELTAEPPLEAHASTLRAWLKDATESFNIGSGFEVRFIGPSDWSAVSARTISLKAETGATLMLEPHETRPALNISPDSIEMSGLLNLSGGKAPKFAAHIKSARLQHGTPVTLETGGVSLKPWTADGLTLAADLNEMSFTTHNGTPRLQTVGEVRLDGPLYGMTLENTRLFGGIDAALDSSGIRIQTHKTKCLGVDIAGLGLSGSFGIGETAFQLCPVNGRVVNQADGVAAGAVDLGNITLPFSGQDTSGTLALEEARLDWRAGDKAQLSIEAGTIRLPLEIGGEQLDVASTDAAFTLRSGHPAFLSAQTGQTEFSGSILPADLGLGSADLSLQFADSGLRGQATASNVRMRDPGDDPLYVPLMGDLTADISNGNMTLTGPVTTSQAEGNIANINLHLNLVTLDGSANIKSETLEFTPGGFQPTALSERVRGLLSNARGELSGEASFKIDGGSPSGEGWVSVSEFGFDTLRLGEITGVSGRLEFSDILALTTPPGQEVHIGKINPGIPLENGIISFQLLEGREALIEKARWPFAGGELIVGESDWTIAGTSDTIRISANGLELIQIINVFNLPDISATGTVSGAFPVEIDGPNAYVRNATLKADETGGKVAYTGDVADAASQADQRVEMAFNALRDFRFSVLELGANGNLSGDMLVTLKLIGKSPEVLDGAPFAFNIGVDSKLMQLVQTGRSVTTSDWLVDAVKKSAAGKGNEPRDEGNERE